MLTPYLALKVIHVLAAIVAVGGNVTYAFWLRRAGHDRERLLWTIEGVRRFDRAIANPTYVVLLISGVLMVLNGGWRFEQLWIGLSLGLYVFVALLGIFIYAPVVRRQLAEADRDPGSVAYATAERRSTFLGVVTTSIVFVIVILMVTKPG
jgi:uncharacterized membrane protein